MERVPTFTSCLVCGHDCAGRALDAGGTSGLFRCPHCKAVNDATKGVAPVRGHPPPDLSTSVSAPPALAVAVKKRSRRGSPYRMPAEDPSSGRIVVQWRERRMGPAVGLILGLLVVAAPLYFQAAVPFMIPCVMFGLLITYLSLSMLTMRWRLVVEDGRVELAFRGLPIPRMVVRSSRQGVHTRRLTFGRQVIPPTRLRHCQVVTRETENSDGDRTTWYGIGWVDQADDYHEQVLHTDPEAVRFILRAIAGHVPRALDGGTHAPAALASGGEDGLP